MIPFITNAIHDPWSDSDVQYFEKYGSQRDTTQYNSYYNWRLLLTEKNIYLCSMKTIHNEYKNVYLFAVTRNLFYFVIYIPQLDVIKKLNNEDNRLNRYVSHLPLISKCLKSVGREDEMSQDIIALDGNCLLVKVNAPIENFLFPRNKCITNDKIKQQYIVLNNLYAQIDNEYDTLYKMVCKYNAAIQRKVEERKEKLKTFAVKRGVRLGLSLALAGLTAGISLGVDALFDLSDMSDIQDFIDLADSSDVIGSLSTTMDISDFADPDVLNFDISDVYSMDIADNNEYDSFLADSHNISFGSQHEHLTRRGGGLGGVDVTITKKAGTANEFVVSPKIGRDVVVKGGDKFVELNGKHYILPSLRG